MTFDDLRTPQSNRLPTDHPVWYMENKINREIHPKKPAHDAEHLEMCKYFGIDESKCDSLAYEEGKPDRFWHLSLHIRYWKELGMYEEVVQEFEEKTGVDSLTTPLP